MNVCETSDGGVCFSPEADLIAGAAVTAIGIDALRHVEEPREYPLASLPIILGTHLLVETFVWWGASGDVPAFVGRTAVWIYLAVALGLLPFLVPAAVTAVEPDPRRRRWLMPLVALGAAVAASLMAGVITGPIGARIVEGCCISYDTGPNHIPVLGGLYVVVTCMPMVLSSYRPMIVFGVVNLVAVGLLAWLLAAGYASLWCAWAAVTSVLIAIHLRKPRRTTPVGVTDTLSD
jgi:hypothetical protein